MSDPWGDAVQTMRAELAVQRDVVSSALDQASPQLPALQRFIGDDGELLSVGVGDSDLVGRLAFCSGGGRRVARALRSNAILRDVRPRLALCQSISGGTASTVAAARALTAGGTPVVALTAERVCQLNDVADVAITVDIPRCEPDAKVPGTITVTVPLAVTRLIQLYLGGKDATVAVHEVRSSLASGLDAAERTWSRWAGELEDEATSVSFVADPEREPLAAYGQAKLAEAVGWQAASADVETWLHVGKHAVHPGTVVVGLDPDDAYAGWYASIDAEARSRGGRLLRPARPVAAALFPEPCRIGFPQALDFAGVIERLRLLQGLTLHLLERGAPWAPYQLHRISREHVKGIWARQYQCDWE